MRNCPAQAPDDFKRRAEAAVAHDCSGARGACKAAGAAGDDVIAFEMPKAVRQGDAVGLIETIDRITVRGGHDETAADVELSRPGEDGELLGVPGEQAQMSGIPDGVLRTLCARPDIKANKVVRIDDPNADPAYAHLEFFAEKLWGDPHLQGVEFEIDYGNGFVPLTTALFPDNALTLTYKLYLPITPSTPNAVQGRARAVAAAAPPVGPRPSLRSGSGVTSQDDRRSTSTLIAAP